MLVCNTEEGPQVLQAQEPSGDCEEGLTNWVLIQLEKDGKFLQEHPQEHGTLFIIPQYFRFSSGRSLTYQHFNNSSEMDVIVYVGFMYKYSKLKQGFTTNSMKTTQY